MIIQLINNISWASLLVSESKTWQCRTHKQVKENNISKDRIRTAKIEIKGAGENNV
jgi:hypothetical protein